MFFQKLGRRVLFDCAYVRLSLFLKNFRSFFGTVCSLMIDFYNKNCYTYAVTESPYGTKPFISLHNENYVVFYYRANYHIMRIMWCFLCLNHQSQTFQFAAVLQTG